MHGKNTYMQCPSGVQVNKYGEESSEVAEIMADDLIDTLARARYVLDNFSGRSNQLNLARASVFAKKNEQERFAIGRLKMVHLNRVKHRMYIVFLSLVSFVSLMM